MTRTRQEATEVLQLLLPQLESVDIPIVNVKTDVSTRKTKPLRGDVWISREQFTSPRFEREIIALIEAKTATTVPGSLDWTEAFEKGQKKADRQGLPFFIVTNTSAIWRYYRTSDGKEITLDGVPITRPLGISDLELLNTQISLTCYDAISEGQLPTRHYSEREFQSALWQIKNVYRNCALDNADSKIYTTISFVVLKYISEQEKIKRTLPRTVLLWDDWRTDHMDRDIRATIEDIRRGTLYADVAKELAIAPDLGAEHCLNIHEALTSFQFSGCNFDLYGAVYESFADNKMKREFGQYYTRRHIASALSELVLKGEIFPRTQGPKICDPACGTGGFLTEAYRIMLRNYKASGALQARLLRRLRENTFYGFDIKERNIALARINMCLAGDGHTHINTTPDSLVSLPENEYDFVLTNVPYGLYKGAADVDQFHYSNKRRYENLFLEKIVRALRPRGKAVIIVPDGILESPSLETYRIHLLNDVRIEAVISLHPYVFRPYTTEKTYAVIVEKMTDRQRGRKCPDPVWMYIMQNDGYQKGDKRYPINENDIPDLLLHYLSTNAQAPNRFIDPMLINESNFHNLLPEFHLNYYEDDYVQVDFDRYKELIGQVAVLCANLKGFSDDRT